MSKQRNIIKRPPGGWDMQRVTTHPGEMLLEEFLKPLNLSAAEAARRMRLPARQLRDILRQHKPMTADVALRVERMFGTSADFWLRLQNSHDLTKARLTLGKSLTKAVKRYEWQKIVDAA